MPVSVSSDLPLPAGTVADLLARPAVLQFLLWPLLTVSPPGSPRFGIGEDITITLRLGGLIPLWRHTLRVVETDPTTGSAITEEHGGPLRRWRHTMTVEPLTAGTSRYTDRVEIDAGRSTRLAAHVARGLYRHRHRRWQTLARLLS